MEGMKEFDEKFDALRDNIKSTFKERRGTQLMPSIMIVINKFQAEMANGYKPVSDEPTLRMCSNCKKVYAECKICHPHVSA